MRAIVIGATSGIGRAVAGLMAEEGWTVGIAGRRREMLESFVTEHPGADIRISDFDVTAEDSPSRLMDLIGRTGGADLIFIVSGVGKQNRELDPNIELNTVKVNCLGYVRMADAAFRYFRERSKAEPGFRGHLAIVSSVAGTKGMGTGPAYSSTKRFQSTYLDSLAQLSRMNGFPLDVTDIRPGFVRTDILSRDKNYPMLMTVQYASELIFNALKRRRRRAYIDWRFALLAFLWSIVPQCLWERMTGFKS